MQELVKGKNFGHDERKGVAGQGGEIKDQPHHADHWQKAEQAHVSHAIAPPRTVDALAEAMQQDTALLSCAEQR